jgi:rubrerythrin
MKIKVTKEVLEIIKSAILQEIKARDFYRAVYAQLQDRGASLKLDVMAETEEEHRRILTNWYKELTGKEPSPPEEEQEGRIKIEYPMIDATLQDVVRIIYEAEERAYQFYKEAADRTEEPESKKVFLKLAQMEKGHEDFFRDEYQVLAEDVSIRFADEEIPWMIEEGPIVP